MPYCKQCSKETIRIDRYDAYACPNCVIWEEPACGDPACEMCKDRPATPENVDWEDTGVAHKHSKLDKVLALTARVRAKFSALWMFLQLFPWARIFAFLQQSGAASKVSEILKKKR